MEQDNTTQWRRVERFNSSGDLLLSHNHIAMLNGLFDRPGGRASSTADLARAAYPYVSSFRSYPKHWLLEMAAGSINPAWVTHERPGHRYIWTLTPRGVAILELKVRSWIRGFGPYHGMRFFRDLVPVTRTTAAAFDTQDWSKRGWAGVDEWWDLIQDHPLHGGVAEQIEQVVDAWSAVFPRLRDEQEEYQWGFQPVMAGKLRRYICWHVMTHRVFPKGVHRVPEVPELEDTSGFAVDFDDLET